MGKITLKSIIDTIESENEVFNKEMKKLVENNSKIKSIPRFRFSELEAQNQTIEKMFQEFNIGVNNNSYIFKNSDDPVVKTLEFTTPIFIKEAVLFVNGLVYENPIRFKVVLHTIDNEIIETHMMPYEFRGDYIEEIKFMANQKKSLFKAMNNEEFEYYDIVNNSGVGYLYKKTDFNYTDFVDQDGYINFKTEHRKDKVLCKYTPISSEFVKTINERITSISLVLDKEYNEEIKLNITI